MLRSSGIVLILALAATSARADVLIGGAGFAGLALAIALRQGLGSSFVVTVADPALGRAGADARASAIVAAARRLFETIGVWETVADGAQPVHDRYPPVLERHGARVARLDAHLVLDLAQRDAAESNRAAILLALQRYPEALATAESVLSRRPDHVGAQQHRRLALWALARAATDLVAIFRK